jgi:hypothetical protein
MRIFHANTEATNYQVLACSISSNASARPPCLSTGYFGTTALGYIAPPYNECANAIGILPGSKTTITFCDCAIAVVVTTIVDRANSMQEHQKQRLQQQQKQLSKVLNDANNQSSITLNLSSLQPRCRRHYRVAQSQEFKRRELTLCFKLQDYSSARCRHIVHCVCVIPRRVHPALIRGGDQTAKKIDMNFLQNRKTCNIAHLCNSLKG